MQTYEVDAGQNTRAITHSLHRRRATLGVVQYEERIRIASGRNTVRVSYVPLTTVAPAMSPIVSARGRYAIPRRGEWPFDDLSSDVAMMFGLPNSWTAIDPTTIDVYADTGDLTLPVNAVGLGFSELDVSYTAGLETFPDAVKEARAQIVRNAQATPALNVRAREPGPMHLEIFPTAWSNIGARPAGSLCSAQGGMR